MCFGRNSLLLKMFCMYPRIVYSVQGSIDTIHTFLDMRPFMYEQLCQSKSWNSTMGWSSKQHDWLVCAPNVAAFWQWNNGWWWRRSGEQTKRNKNWLNPLSHSKLQLWLCISISPWHKAFFSQILPTYVYMSLDYVYRLYCHSALWPKQWSQHGIISKTTCSAKNSWKHQGLSVVEQNWASQLWYCLLCTAKWIDKSWRHLSDCMME